MLPVPQKPSPQCLSSDSAVISPAADGTKRSMEYMSRRRIIDESVYL